MGLACGDMGCGASTAADVVAKYAAPSEPATTTPNGTETVLLRTPRLPEATEELEFHNRVAERKGKLAFDAVKTEDKLAAAEERQVSAALAQAMGVLLTLHLLRRSRAC